MSKIKEFAKNSTPVQHFNDQMKKVTDQVSAVREHGKKTLSKWMDYASSDWLEKMDELLLKVQKPLIALDDKITEIDASIERSIKSRRSQKKRSKQEELDLGRFVSEGGAQTTILDTAGKTNSATAAPVPHETI